MREQPAETAPSTLSKEGTIKFLETYIDSAALAKLEDLGVLKKKGAGPWYYVLKPDDVPHAIACIPNQMEKREKNGDKTLLWKFPSPGEVKKARSLLARISGN